MDFTYTAEDFATEKPYEELLAIESSFERKIRLKALATYAKDVCHINGFGELFSAYRNDRMTKNNTVYVDSFTNFTAQPLELQCGEWRADDGGVSRRGAFGGEEIACCHPIMPVERLVNIDTGVVKLRLAYSRGGQWKDVVLDKQTLATAQKIVSLSDLDIAVTSENAKLLVKYVHDLENINYDIIPERKSVSRLGYIDGEGFSPYVDGLIFDGDANYGKMFSAISTHGESSDWVSIAKECRAMSTTARIMLAASFASVMVQPFGALPFFVHLWASESGTGKSVALMLAASVWGDPTIGRYIQTFDATDVGHERVAAFLNSLPMMIDEMQLIKDRRGKNGFNVYKLAQGVGRTRGTKTGGIERTPTWNNCILTTGEGPLVTLSDGAGAINRVIDIECGPSEQVIFDGIRISNALKRSYGHAGKLFVKNISKPSVTELARELFDNAFRDLSSRDTTEKQAIPAALIIVADKLATEWFFRDGLSLSADQIAEFLQTKAAVSAGERGYRYMCDWVAQNLRRFDPSSEAGEIYGDVKDGFAYIITKVFRENCENGGFSSAALISFLKSKRLIRTSERGGVKRNTVGHRIGGMNTECIAMVLPIEETDIDDFIDL